MPWGMSFNETTGTFTGTPTETGEYVVPVRVQTNYGQDQKDVYIVVENPASPVYAIGAQAATWSNNAEPDAYGFRRLPMPNAKKLSALSSGFGAYTVENNWYVCGVSENYYGQPDMNFTTPKEYPVPDIVEMTGGASSGSSVSYVYMLYRTKDNKGVIHTLRTTTYSSSERNEVSGVKALNTGYCYGYGYITEEDRLYAPNVYGVASSGAVKAIINERNGGNGRIYYVTDDGELYNTLGKIETTCGKIAKIYPNYHPLDNYDTFFVLNEQGELYGIGSNSYCQLGLSDKKSYAALTKSGDYDVKTISSVRGVSFMLTTDGKLYHTGQKVNNVTDEHEGWTEIYSGMKFIDMVYTNGANTLVVIKE